MPKIVMKILLKTNILLCFVLLLFGLIAKAQTRGFIGSKNSISLDVSSLIQQEIKFQYNVHINKHQVLIINATRQNINDGALFNLEGDSLQIDLMHKNNSVGVGFMRNSKKLKMPMPIGFYYGLCYQRHWGTLNQNMEGLMLDTYQHRSNLAMIILGRGIAISPKFFIDTSVNAGIKFGRYFLSEEELYNIPPLVVYPYNLPFTKSSNKIEETSNDTYSYKTVYAMPNLKIGFLF